MGPYHGKLVIHGPSGTIGIASSRRGPTGLKERESWDYSLRCADRSRTPFFPQWQLRLASSAQKSRFLQSRQGLAPARPHHRPHIRRDPDGSANRPFGKLG